MEEMKILELPSPAPGHKNAIFEPLKERYDSGNYPYVLVLHVDQHKHCIVGVFDSLEVCLVARCYANLATKIHDNYFYQAHRTSGETIDKMMYDLRSGVITEAFEVDNE